MSLKQKLLFAVLLALAGGLFFAVFSKDHQRGATGQAVKSNHNAPMRAARAEVTTAGVDVFESFNKWRENYGKATPNEHIALEGKGVILAAARQKVLADLARNDPSRALGLVLSLAELADLPENIRTACEQPLNTTGSIDLRWLTGMGGGDNSSCHHQNVAFAGDRSWKVNGPDYMDARPPRADVPIDGYVIDNELLVEPVSVRKLDRANLAAAVKIFPRGNPVGVDPVTGNPAKPDFAALIGGKVFLFENDAVINHVISRLDQADREATAKNVFKPDYGFTWLEADGGSGFVSGGAPVEATPFLADTINVLFIRVDFTDKQGEPVTQANLQSSLASVSSHLQNYSYGVASFSPTPTVTSQVYRLGSSTTYTSSSNGSNNLMAAARSAAAANYTLANYNVVAIYFPALTGTDFNYSGLASVGGSDHWINGLTTNSSRIQVMVHEFGHNYGLYHANYYDPSHEIGGAYNDPAAASLEYGDIFDRMGGATDPATGYFGPFATARLNWMPAGKIAQATANGTWRIYRFDTPTALGNPLLSLRVPIGGGASWWVGLRKLFPLIANSAYVVSDGIYTNRPTLIDMTPNSLSPETSDRTDAGLPVGSSFYDAAKGVRLRTLASGGTAPNEWIDVQVEFDSQLQLVSNTIEVDEQAGSAVITLRRTFGSSGPATVNYATANGTATAGSDYYAVSGSVTWADGDLSDKQVLVPIRPDTINDGGETFTFTLSGATGATLIASPSVATVTLRDPGQRLTSFLADFFNTTVKAIARLSNGSILIGGNLDSGITGNIARLNPDGTNDSTFVKGTGFNGEVRSIVVQSDGKILVGGAFTSYGATLCNRLVRLNADGTVDAAFVTAMGTGADATVNAIAIEATGKILVGGDFSNFSGNPMEGLVRLTSTGARDTVSPLSLPFEPTFGSRIIALLVQDDSKIMAVGSFYGPTTATGFRSGIARLTATGARDATFDPDAGLHFVGSIGTLGNAETIIRQSDGKYVVGGFFSAYDENPAPNIARVNSNGTFDNTFVPPAFNNSIKSLLAQPSGAIVVAGTFNSPVSGLERLLTNGTVDNTFQQGTGPGGTLYSIAADTGGAFWVGGNFFSYDGASVWPVVKVAGGVSAYDAWVSLNFTAAQITAGIADPEDDSDGDGIKNIAEMALGTSPTTFNTNKLFTSLAGSTSLVTSGPASYFQSTFARSSANPGVWLSAQFSTNLTTWLPANPLPGTNSTYDIIEDSTTRFTVRDKTPANTVNPKRFLRFVAKKPN